MSMARSIGTAANAWTHALSREVPLALRALIVADVGEELVQPDIVNRLSAMGYIPGALSPTDFVASLERERARWTKGAHAYGARPTR